MLDTHKLREDVESAAAALKRRGCELDIARFEELRASASEHGEREQELRARRNRVSKRIGERVAEGLDAEEAKSEVAEELAEIDRSLSECALAAGGAKAALRDFLAELPNLPAAEIPDGDDESANREVARVGDLPEFDFEPRDHVDIGAELGLDLEAAARLAGARFMVLRGPLARLHRALGHFMLDLHTREHGYTEIWVPTIGGVDSLFGSGQLPKFAADLFKLQQRDAYLIPTAETPLLNLYREQLLDEAHLRQPLKLTARSSCYRSEAGSYGQDTRGILRQHEFEKVELIQIARADQAETAFEDLLASAEAVLDKLQLPYRKVLLCAGDMGFAARRTYDLEVWMPGQGRYREISSCSDCGDFQSRRMRLRHRAGEGGTRHPHTFNASGVAVGRCLAALLENNQRADGSVELPAVLHPYMDGERRLNV